MITTTNRAERSHPDTKSIVAYVASLGALATLTGLAWVVAYYQYVGFYPDLGSSDVKNLLFVVLIAGIFGTGKYIGIAAVPGIIAASAQVRRSDGLAWSFDGTDRRAAWLPLFVALPLGTAVAVQIMPLQALGALVNALLVAITIIITIFCGGIPTMRRLAAADIGRVRSAITIVAVTVVWLYAALALLFSSSWEWSTGTPKYTGWQFFLGDVAELGILAAIALFTARGRIADILVAIVAVFVLFISLNQEKLVVPFESAGLSNFTLYLAKGESLNQLAKLCQWKSTGDFYEMHVLDAVGSAYIGSCKTVSGERYLARIRKDDVHYSFVKAPVISPAIGE